MAKKTNFVTMGAKMPSRTVNSLLEISHLGILASLFKRYEIVEKVDKLLPKNSNNFTISHGEAVQAMVLQCLGNQSNRLYLAKDFFSGVAIKKLFREDIDSGDFNATALGRTLDAISAYGPSKFFMEVFTDILMRKNALGSFYHVDTTSLYFTGKYKDSKNNDVVITHGHSKDGKPNLKQIVYLLVANEEGMPIYSETHSGNKSDQSIFSEVIESLQIDLDTIGEEKFFVLDSSIYSKNFIRNSSILSYWIVRVPEKIKQCREAVEKNYKDDEWTKIDSNYKYIEFERRYGGEDQRWLLVCNRSAKYKELETLKNRLDKEEKRAEKRAEALSNKKFVELEELQFEVSQLRKNYPNFNFALSTAVVKKKVRKTFGRKGYTTRATGYRGRIKVSRKKRQIEKLERRKGRFIIGTNCMDRETLSTEKLLEAYRNQTGTVETAFKFIKNRKLCLNQVCLKKTDRIEAYMAILTIVLFINNLSQLTIRKHLVKNGKYIPNQLGKKYQKPTFRWVTSLMRGIWQVVSKIRGRISESIENINKTNETIIKAFGADAMRIYGID